MMFCTGGIRCERASALLRDKGYQNEIYQMQGGIHSYLENHPKDGGFWVGKNYTFDKRYLLFNGQIWAWCREKFDRWEMFSVRSSLG